ncbi:MAG: hypothetical protein OER95_15230 [Acidimicrobiia bacterium]|nr:hypothetical protein [Acidimicrobiia bacterium]
MRVQKLMAAAAAGAAIVGLGLFGTAAGAEEADPMVEIPVAHVYGHGEPGSSVAMGSAEVGDDLVGQTCDVVAKVTNQESAHPGNKLVVTSGDSSVEIAGIEDTAGAVTVKGGSLTLAKTVSVAVVLGEDGATSLGSSLAVTCEPLPATKPTSPTPTQPTYTG